MKIKSRTNNTSMTALLLVVIMMAAAIVSWVWSMPGVTVT